MNNQLKFDVRKLRLLLYTFRYSPYYAFFLPVISCVVSILLLLFFINPQINSWFSIQSEIQAVQGRIKTIRTNRNTMELINIQEVQQDFDLASLAVQAEKDFASIILALSQAASDAQVSLGDYTFSLATDGGSAALADLEVVEEAAPEEIVVAPSIDSSGGTPVTIEIPVEGDVDAVNRFVLYVERKVPLVKIIGLTYAENSANIQISFDIKPFTPLQIQDDAVFNPLSSEEKKTLQQLRALQAS